MFVIVYFIFVDEVIEEWVLLLNMESFVYIEFRYYSRFVIESEVNLVLSFFSWEMFIM